MGDLLRGDKYIFQRHIQMFDGRNFQLAKGTGTKFGTEETQKLAFYGATPVNKPETVTVPSLVLVSGSGDDTTINQNFTKMDNGIADLISRLQELGIIK